MSVYNAGPATTDVVIDMNGYFAAPTDVNGNTAIGAGALANNTTGTHQHSHRRQRAGEQYHRGRQHGQR